MECIISPGLVTGRMREKWRAILPQGIATREIEKREGIRESNAEEAESREEHETEVIEDGSQDRTEDLLIYN